jgi:hypothetical protein
MHGDDVVRHPLQPTQHGHSRHSSTQHGTARAQQTQQYTAWQDLSKEH